MMVVFLHTMAKSENSGMYDNFFHVGSSGVDLFFIISGYIIVYITENRKPSPRYFIVSRVERVYPTYLIVTLAALCVYIVAPSMINASGDTSLIMSFFYIPIEDHLMLVQVGWTLIYEMFFYFIFFLSMIINFKNRIAICSIFIVIIALTFNKFEIYQLKYLSNTIIVEFIYGMLSFHIIKKINNIKLSLFMIALGLISLYIYRDTFSDRFIYYGIPMLLLFMGVVSIEVNNKVKIESKLLKLLGDASYSIYLTHLFSIGIAFLIFRKLNIEPILFVLTSILLSAIGGVIYYLIIEKNIMKFFKMINKKYIS